MKRFLLIAGHCYYPRAGTEDWVGMFDTLQEAEALVQKTQRHEYFLQGPRKGQIKATREDVTINGHTRDWYEIVDMQDWWGR